MMIKDADTLLSDEGNIEFGHCDDVARDTLLELQSASI